MVAITVLLELTPSLAKQPPCVSNKRYLKMNNHDTITQLKPSTISNNRTSSMLRAAFGVHIQEYLKDDSIVEIMLDPNGHIWCERLGTGLFDTGNCLSKDSALRVIKLIASATDQVCNEEKPSLQASLPETG